MGNVLESRESSKNEDGKTDIIYKTMYANSEDFQVLAISMIVSSFVAEWNDQTMKIQSGVKGGIHLPNKSNITEAGGNRQIAKATDDCRCVYGIPLFRTS